MALREKILKDYEKGKKAEKLFEKIVISREYECSEPANDIDISQKWDRKIIKNKKEARVQIKGLKDAHKFGYTWLELKNDSGVEGSGWLYGKAHVLAILLPDKKTLIPNRFEFYRMDLLRKLVDEKVDKTKPILKGIPKKENGENDYEYMRFRQYNGYNRRGDFTVIVSLKDIEHCKVFTMEFSLEEFLKYDKEISSI